MTPLGTRLVPALLVRGMARTLVFYESLGFRLSRCHPQREGASWAEEFRGKVVFAWGPEVMDCGMREFAIQDPDGYYLAFTEPAAETSESAPA